MTEEENVSEDEMREALERAGFGYLSDVLLPVVRHIVAEELRAAASALSRPSEGAAYEVWAHGGGDWLRARADRIDTTPVR